MDFRRLGNGDIGGGRGRAVAVHQPVPDLVRRRSGNENLCGSGKVDCTGFQTFTILDILLVLAAFAPLILVWIVVRGHELSWPPGEVTMIVGRDRGDADPLQRRSSTGSGRTASSSSLDIGWYIGLLGVADDHRRRRDQPDHARRRRAQAAGHVLAQLARAHDGGERRRDKRDRPRSARHERARSQPRARARARDRVGRARRRALGRPRREGGRRPGGGRRDAVHASRRADGRHRRDRRGREGRGADALQRRADRRRQPAGGRPRGRPARGHAPHRAAASRTRCRSSRSPSAARCSTRGPASTWRRSPAAPTSPTCSTSTGRWARR